MMLITPSLLNSFSYYFSYQPEASGEGDEFVSAEEKEADVRADFLRTLSREKSAPNESMQKGIDFETDVLAYCNGDETESGPIREIGELCKGGMWQQAVKKELDGYLLYGKTDVIKRDTVIDVKYTASYDVGKFLSSQQHRIYLYCTGLPKASYLISNGRDWWREDYFNHGGIEQEIRDAIRHFTGHLENDPEAKALYYSKWVSYGD